MPRNHVAGEDVMIWKNKEDPVRLQNHMFSLTVFG